jgi:hypothetical protein
VPATAAASLPHPQRSPPPFRKLSRFAPKCADSRKKSCSSGLLPSNGRRVHSPWHRGLALLFSRVYRSGANRRPRRCVVLGRAVAEKLRRKHGRPGGVTRRRRSASVPAHLAAQYKRELEEIRSGGGDTKFSTTGYERSFSPEPLYQAFAVRGSPAAEPAQVPWTEFRAITWTGSVDNLSQPRRPPTSSRTTSSWRSPMPWTTCYGWQCKPGASRRQGRIRCLSRSARP